ncbi:TRAP transporter large permease [Spirochaetota bacterium]
MIYIIILIFILLLLFGTPLYTILFGGAVLLLLSIGEPDLIIALEVQKLQTNPILAAIPLFTFAGFLLARSRTPDRIVTLFNTVFSFIPKANSVIVLIIMALFTALTGASGISILAVGGLMLPLLIKGGRSEKYSLGLITASGSIGLLFPPSLPVIMYGIIASQIIEGSVDIKLLYKIGFIPAIILISGVIIYSYIKKEKKTDKPAFNLRNIWQAVRNARWEIPIPIIVYGGIYSGFFTLTEAAIVTAVYVFIMEFFLYKDLSFKKDFLDTIKDSMILTGGILVIMTGASGLTTYIIDQEIAERVFESISPYLANKYQFLLVVNIFLLFCGCFLDIFSAIIIVCPILLPLVEKFGINPYHFAIIFMINLEIGYMTPPVGLNLFISSYRFKRKITDLYKASVPFLLVRLIILIVITYIPAISTFLLK